MSRRRAASQRRARIAGKTTKKGKTDADSSEVNKVVRAAPGPKSGKKLKSLRYTSNR